MSRYEEITLEDLKATHKRARTDHEAAVLLKVDIECYRRLCDDYSLLTLGERERSLRKYQEGTSRRPREDGPTDKFTKEEVEAILEGHKTILAASQSSGVSYTRIRYWAIEYGLYTPSRRVSRKKRRRQ